MSKKCNNVFANEKKSISKTVIFVTFGLLIVVGIIYIICNYLENNNAIDKDDKIVEEVNKENDNLEEDTKENELITEEKNINKESDNEIKQNNQDSNNKYNSELNENTIMPSKEIKSVELSTSNWKSYYDITITNNWDDLAFNIYGHFTRDISVGIKDEYYDKELLKEHPEFHQRISMEIKLKCYDSNLEVDWIDKTYKEISINNITEGVRTVSGIYDDIYNGGYWTANLAVNDGRLEKSEIYFSYCDIDDITNISGIIYYYEK